MAALHGSSGLATLDSPYDTGLKIFEWSGNIVNDEYPADLFIDENDPGALGHIFYYGMYQFRGKIRAFLDSDTNLDASQIAPSRTSVTVTLIARQGGTDQRLFMVAHLNNFAIVVNKQSGLNAVDADIVSTGGITSADYVAV